MVPKTCSAADCDSTHEARGWCNKHYLKWKRYGDPLHSVNAQTPEEFEARFWAKVEKTETCWNWTGTRTAEGYGQVLRGTNDRVYAHRYSYELSVAPLWDDMQVDHRCHNRLCVNPEHLRAVTQKQNNENHNGPQVGTTSGVRGVAWRKSDGKWSVQVGHDRKRYYGGIFDSKEDAEAAAVALRLQLHTHNDVDRGIAPSQIVGVGK